MQVLQRCSTKMISGLEHMKYKEKLKDIGLSIWMNAKEKDCHLQLSHWRVYRRHTKFFLEVCSERGNKNDMV